MKKLRLILKQVKTYFLSVKIKKLELYYDEWI